MDFKSLPRLRCAVPHLRAETACLNHPRHQKWEESKAENPNRNSLFPFNDKAQCCCFFSSCIHMQSVFTLMGFFMATNLPKVNKQMLWGHWIQTKQCINVSSLLLRKVYSSPELQTTIASLRSVSWEHIFIVEVRVPSSGIIVYYIIGEVDLVFMVLRIVSGSQLVDTFFSPYHEVTTNFSFSTALKCITHKLKSYHTFYI